MGLGVRCHRRAGDHRAAVRRQPARGGRAAHPATAHNDPRGGHRPLAGRSGRGVATGGPKATRGVEWGRVLPHQSAPTPPASCSTPPTCSAHRDTSMATRPPSGGSPRKAGPPSSPWRISKIGGLRTTTPCPGWATFRGPLLLMLPTDLAAALRRELDSCEGLRVGWEAIADGTLLALPHRDVADGCQWGALVPHLAGHHTYMTTLPRGYPRPAWDDLIAAFHDHWILPDDTWQVVRQKTLGRDYQRRVRAHLLERRDPLCQRRDDLWLCRLGPWSPASHLGHTCHLCGECNTVSSAVPMGINRCARCSQVAACPWPKPSAGPRRRTEKEGLHRRIGKRKSPHTAKRAPQVPPSCGSTCGCGSPRPSRLCRTCLRPDPRPPPRFAEPTAPCLAKRERPGARKGSPPSAGGD